MTIDQKIIIMVCRTCHIGQSQLLSQSRKYPLVAARMLVVLLLKKRGFTDERISWILNRTRPAILNCRHKAHYELMCNTAFRALYNNLEKRFQNDESI